MKIGFDAKRAAQNRTGLGNYSRFVVRVLSQRKAGDEYHLYVPDRTRAPFLHEIPTLGRLRLHFPGGWLWRRLKSLWRVWGVTADVRRDGIGLYHGLSNELPLGIRRAGCRSVVTIHDLIFLRCPEYYHRIDRMIYNYKFRRACRMADRVIAVSEYTKREIMRCYGTPEGKIDVVYQGCDPAFGREIPAGRLKDIWWRYSLPPKFLLYVGSIEERKNLMLAVKAAIMINRSDEIFSLDIGMIHVVAVGRRTEYMDRIENYVREKQAGRWFHFYHNVPYEDLPAFYRLATAFVYPSRIEGFGIPMLEAITAGTPAIGCTGSCLEEAGGPDSIYVDPDDTEGMARAIIRVFTDEELQHRMAERGRRYAERFADERIAEDLAAVYDKAMRQEKNI